MPFKSLAQERYFNGPGKAKLEKAGVDIAEWNSASKGMKLPPRAPTGGLMGKALKRKPKRK